MIILAAIAIAFGLGYLGHSIEVGLESIAEVLRHYLNRKLLKDRKPPTPTSEGEK